MSLFIEAIIPTAPKWPEKAAAAPFWDQFELDMQRATRFPADNNKRCFLYARLVAEWRAVSH